MGLGGVDPRATLPLPVPWDLVLLREAGIRSSSLRGPACQNTAGLHGLGPDSPRVSTPLRPVQGALPFCWPGRPVAVGPPSSSSQRLQGIPLGSNQDRAKSCPRFVPAENSLCVLADVFPGVALGNHKSLPPPLPLPDRRRGGRADGVVCLLLSGALAFHPRCCLGKWAFSFTLVLQRETKAQEVVGLPESHSHHLALFHSELPGCERHPGLVQSGAESQTTSLRAVTGQMALVVT